MADTLTNVSLPANSWVDIYTATGITVGVAIEIQNIGDNDVFLAIEAAEPSSTNAYNIIQRGQFLRNSEGDTGAWAYSNLVAGKVNVRIV